MEKVKENPKSETQPPPNHQMDADDDDENVKQLKECSSLYLSLQVCVCFLNRNHHLFDYPIFNESLKLLLQDCLVDSNRDWKSCQKRMLLSLSQFLKNLKSFRGLGFLPN